MSGSWSFAGNEPRSGRGATLWRTLVGLALVALVLGSWAAPAAAHADLSTTDPTDGSVVEVAPDAVTLVFTERVTIQPDGVRVLTADGARVDGGTATADGSTVTASLDGDIPDGGYLVAWRVISADGHPVRGAFSFSVGQQTELRDDLADEAFAGAADGRDEWAGRILRTLTYIAVLGTAGAVLVGTGLRRHDDPPAVGRGVATLALAGLGALVLQIPVQASLATGQGWGSITDAGVLPLALADGVGWSMAVTGIGLLAVLVTAGLAMSRAVRGLAVGGALLAPAGLALAGHTRTMEPRWLGYSADVAHVWAGAVWFGGLAVLIAIARRRRRAGDVRGSVEAIARFSGWAGLALAGVAVSGTALGWIEVRSLDALTSTAYGRLLMVKVGLVAVVVVGAALNRFRLVPAITPLLDGPGGSDGPAVDAADPVAPDAEPGAVAPTDSEPVPAVPAGDPAPHPGQERAWSAVLTVVRVEVALLVVVLALTGVLVNETPARVAVAPGLATVTTELGDGTVEVVVDPARPGRNDVHVYLFDAAGAPDDRYEAVALELSLPAVDLGPIDREPARAGPGHFLLVGTDLDLAGEWTLRIGVRPDRFTEQSATVTFTVR